MANEKVIWATYMEENSGMQTTTTFLNKDAAIRDAEWQARNRNKKVYILKSVSFVKITEPAPILWESIL